MVEALLWRLQIILFHMQYMVTSETEISANVGGVSADFGGQCHLFPDDQNIQKRNHTVWLYFYSELDELKKENSVVLVRKRTIPTEQPQPSGKLKYWGGWGKSVTPLGHEARPQMCHQYTRATAKVCVVPS
jgi:hypothetical protein